jgi:hypothetical protein
MLRASFLVLLALVTVSPVLATNTSGGVGVRDWKTPNTTLMVPLAFDVQSTAKPTAKRFPGFGDLKVKVNVILEGTTDLRTGEKETFLVDGEYRPAPTSSGSARVIVRLAPQGVIYAYQDLESFNFTRSVEVWGTTGDYEVTFRLTARGRMTTVPPNTISEILLTSPEDAQSMKMTWKDAGNDLACPTSFAWEVWESRWWWKDILIAKGESPADSAAMVSVTLDKTSEQLAQPGVFFQNNKQYTLKLALKRVHADYKPVNSAAYDGGFRYRIVPGGFAERIVTPIGHQLGNRQEAARELNFFHVAP